jgi:hypothetical protein
MFDRKRLRCRDGAINSQSLGRIVASPTAHRLFISNVQELACALVHCAFRTGIQIENFYRTLRASVAGFGVSGPCGPRAGISSGVLPGNSSGRGGSPGSRIGGEISGCGLPGGASIGGSVG